jgi:spore coat protein A
VYEKNRWRLFGAGRNLPNPSIIAEMFGDTMLANGTVYPTVTVEARRYRLRILNACNARFLNLQLHVADPNNPDGITIVNGIAQNAAGPNWLVLGTEAGFLQNPVIVPGKQPMTFDPVTGNVLNSSLLTGNAERWNVIVDFSGFANSDIILYSDSPAPFPGGDPRNDYYYGNPTNPVGPAAGFGPDTRQIMRFHVVTASLPADSALTLVQNQNLNAPVAGPTIDPWNTSVNTGIDAFLATIGANGSYGLNTGVTRTRVLTLNEVFDAYGRLTQMLGTDTPVNGKLAQPYANLPTETPNNGDVEIWEILNLTADTHPIHFHLVNVQILNRQNFNAATYAGGPYGTTGPTRSPDPWELGWKETVKMHPGEVTRVIMKFVVPDIVKADSTVLPTPVSPRTGGNEYAWHCHILEHEEHDMMRPLVVT